MENCHSKFQISVKGLKDVLDLKERITERLKDRSKETSKVLWFI